MKLFSKKIKTIEDIPANKILENADYQKADFSNQKLEYIIFNNVDFRDATFENSTFEGVLFKNCNLNGTNFENTKFIETKKEKELEKLLKPLHEEVALKKFDNAIYYDLDKSISYYNKNYLDNLNFKNAIFESIIFYPDLISKNSNFENTNIVRAVYNDIGLKNSCLKNVNLSKADRLENYYFKNCDLRGANFSFSDSYLCELIDCDLRGANFENFLLDDTSKTEEESIGKMRPVLYFNKYNPEDLKNAELLSEEDALENWEDEE